MSKFPTHLRQKAQRKLREPEIYVDPDYEVRPRVRPLRCQCDQEMRHGKCPGPTNCPNSGVEAEQ